MRSALSSASLVLNSSYEPLCVISVRRAAKLILSEKAECVAVAEGTIKSATMEMPIPSVIRLVTFVKVPYVTRVGLSKRAVLARDGGTCVYCKTNKADTIDHVFPRSKGGKHEWTNVVAACRSCNNKKSNKTLKELGWSLSFRPDSPKGVSWRITSNRFYRPDWAQWGV